VPFDGQLPLLNIWFCAFLGFLSSSGDGFFHHLGEVTFESASRLKSCDCVNGVSFESVDKVKGLEQFQKRTFGGFTSEMWILERVFIGWSKRIESAFVSIGLSQLLWGDWGCLLRVSLGTQLRLRELLVPKNSELKWCEWLSTENKIRKGITGWSKLTVIWEIYNFIQSPSIRLFYIINPKITYALFKKY
jgi:hypothetical protein